MHYYKISLYNNFYYEDIKMLFCISKNTKKTFRWAKLHIRNQIYMNRLLSLHKWDNPSMASPFIII